MLGMPSEVVLAARVDGSAEDVLMKVATRNELELALDLVMDACSHAATAARDSADSRETPTRAGNASQTRRDRAEQ